MTLNNRALARTTFFVGPDEELAAADVYTIKDDGVINNLPKFDDSDRADLTKKLGDEMASGSKMLAGLPIKTNPLLAGAAKIKAESGGLLDKAKALAGSALSAIGGISGAAKIVGAVAGPSLLTRLGGSSISGIPGLSSSGLGSLTSALTSGAVPSVLKMAMSSPIANSLGSVASVGNLAKSILPAQLGSAGQMSGLIQSVVGGAAGSAMSLIDKDGTSRLISGMASAAMSSGLPNSFSSVLSLAGGNQSIISSAATTALQFAAKSGNMSGIKDIATSVGTSVLKANSGPIIASLTSAWSSATSPGQKPAATFAESISALSSLDPSWMKADRTITNPDGSQVTEKILDISCVVNGSNDFKSAMATGAKSTNDTDLKFLSMATMFPADSPESQLKKTFPLTATSILTDTTPNTETLVAARDWRQDVTIDGKYGDSRDATSGVNNNTTVSGVNNSTFIVTPPPPPPKGMSGGEVADRASAEWDKRGPIKGWDNKANYVWGAMNGYVVI